MVDSFYAPIRPAAGHLGGLNITVKVQSSSIILTFTIIVVINGKYIETEL